MSIEELIAGVEDCSDNIIRKCRDYIAPIGRLLLLLTFFEDVFQLVTSFGESSQADFEYSTIYGILSLIARTYCIITQVVAPCLIIRRKHVFWSCYALATVQVMETIKMEVFRNHRILTRTTSVLGGIAVLLGEAFAEREKETSKGPDMPLYDKELPTSSIFLVLGRCYSVFVAITIVHLDMNDTLRIGIILQLLTTLGIVFPLLVGYKTRKMAFLVAIWLIFLYALNNTIGWEPDYTGQDFRKYDFLQTVSAIGSLLLVIHNGPGEISIDEQKKQW